MFRAGLIFFALSLLYVSLESVHAARNTNSRCDHVVHKGNSIYITFKVKGIEITVPAIALDHGKHMEKLSVLNSNNGIKYTVIAMQNNLFIVTGHGLKHVE